MYFQKKRCIAMLLAGGQGSRLKVLTEKTAKPAVPFGGKYRIIDFPLSNCVNSGIDTVGILTQYQPLELNEYIGNGQPWNLNKTHSCAQVLPPYERHDKKSSWYKGTANAIYQNIDFIDRYDPDYVVILSGDHIYKMDYAAMVEYHEKHNASCTIAVRNVPLAEASRFGILNTNPDMSIYEFEEKPARPKSTNASMGIYVFNWSVLKAALQELKDVPSCDFGKHIIPHCHQNGAKVVAYDFKGYWKDVGTLGSYWEANMELVDIIPEFNLYEEFWKIYTKGDIIRPQYVSGDAVIDRCIIGEGAEIYGEVHNSVIGADVRIEKGVVVRDSIIMRHSTIGEGTQVNKAIIAENVQVGKHVVMGVGEEAPNVLKPNIYGFGLVTVGEKAVIPDGVTIGKNVCISGETSPEDYPDGTLPSGGAIVEKDGE